MSNNSPVSPTLSVERIEAFRNLLLPLRYYGRLFMVLDEAGVRPELAQTMGDAPIISMLFYRMLDLLGVPNDNEVRLIHYLLEIQQAFESTGPFVRAGAEWIDSDVFFERLIQKAIKHYDPNTDPFLRSIR